VSLRPEGYASNSKNSGIEWVTSLRTIVIGPDPRLTAKSVVGILDALDVRWALLVGDRIGGELAWELAATRLDRFIGLVVIDRGHPRIADLTGGDPRRALPASGDEHHRAGQHAGRAGGRQGQPSATCTATSVWSICSAAQRAGVHRAAGRGDRIAHQQLVAAGAAALGWMLGALPSSTRSARHLGRRPRLRQAGTSREQEVNESVCGGLWLVVGEARALVGLDEHVVGPGDIRNEKVDARHRDADRGGRRNRHRA